jgi:sec-independent protein translocase protein TatC
MSNENEPIKPATDGDSESEESGAALVPVPKAQEYEEKSITPSELVPAADSIPVLHEPEVTEPKSEGAGTEETESSEGQGMSFLDHLEEIRWRLIKAGAAFLVVTILCAYYADFLVNVVLIGPLKHSGPDIVLQNLVPYGQLSLYMQVVLFSGFVLSFPVIVYQIWKFVEPGLHESERKASKFIILFISLCFFTGLAFGYFVFLPISLKFFAGFGSSLIKNNIAVQDYVSFFLGTLLTAGIVFELPFISYILSKVGLLTPAFMRFYRKHAIVVMLIIAAIVTPSTDMVTQLVIAIPMILLYELSIFISADVQRKRNRQAIQESGKS